jgi:hypothetical protein
MNSQLSIQLAKVSNKNEKPSRFGGKISWAILYPVHFYLPMIPVSGPLSSVTRTKKRTKYFTGVNVVSNSFADECIAKLLLEMPLAELKRRTTFRGLNPLAERSVLVALQRRYKVLLSN